MPPWAHGPAPASHDPYLGHGMLRGWSHLLTLSDAQFAAQDIATMNLACAAGLPGAPSLAEARECLIRLDHYAEAVKDFTARRMGAFYQEPSVYRNSVNIFRIVCMVNLLRGAFGLRYNPAKIDPTVPMGAADTFIHGALVGQGGTCASVPVVHVAVGRRLGYPLKLVMAPHHLFFRWDEPGGECFNMEVNNHGCDSPADEYYANGKYAFPSGIAEAACLLKSLTPRQEFANFLCQRGHRCIEMGNYREACEAFIWSSATYPENVAFQANAKEAPKQWKATLDTFFPNGWPRIVVKYVKPRKYPEFIPVILERQVTFYGSVEEWLRDPVKRKMLLAAPPARS